MGAPQLVLTFEKMTLFNDKRVNFAKYSKFANVEDFNNHWEQFMVDYKQHFTKLQLDALRVYRQFALKNTGVVNASYRTLLDAAHKLYGREMKRDTFRTAIQKLEKLGGCVIANGQRLEKGRGSRTANIVIFNRIDEVKAYQIAQKKKEEQEMARLLEENYATASPIVNYSNNARKWAEEKQRKQAEQQRKQAEQQRKQAEQAAKNKKVSLYRQIAQLMSHRKALKSLNLNEFVGIAYGSINKLVKANVSQADAEQIAYNKLVEIADKDNVKNPAALYSWTLQQVLATLNGEIKTMTKAEQTIKQGKQMEIVPDWMIEKEQDPIKRAEMRSNNEYLLSKLNRHKQEETPNIVDFERLAAEVKARLGQV